MFVAAGAPRGHKHTSVTRLPEYLTDAPAAVRAEFAEWYVRERGVAYPDKATRRIQVDRPLSFYEAIASLIEAVTGEPVTVSNSGMTISAAAVRALGIE